MSTNVQLVITAIQKGVRQTVEKTTSEISTGFQKSRLAVKAFNDTVGNGHKAISSVTGAIKTLVGAYAGMAFVSGVTTIIKEADQAAFNLKSSVAAANREFKDTGSVKEWEDSISRLSNELVIYSDTALKNAVSRTVDMTKRLGLSKEQMEEVIKRSADLGAGKVKLEGAIERVTAAIRGEAESAEYLGLTLNENYIKAWYEASGATQGAWKDLTDMEKAQIRYLVLLEQSNEAQGRAAESAKTFSGAMSLVRKEIENSILNNKDVVGAMKDLATTMREHAGDIGEAISTLLTWMTKAIEIAVKYKNVILSFVGLVVVVSVIENITRVVWGLHAAFVALTGLGIIKWLGTLRLAIAAIAGAGTLAAGGLWALLSVATLKGIQSIYKLTKEIFALNSALKENAKMADQATQEAQQYAWAKDTEIKSKEDLIKMSRAEQQEYKEATKAAMMYYSRIEAAARLNSTDAVLGGLLPFQSKKGKENEKKAGELSKVTNQYTKALKEATDAGKAMVEAGAVNTGQRIASVRKLKDTEIEEAKKATAAIKKELDKRLEDHKKLTEDIVALEEKLTNQKIERADDLREIEQRGMTEAELSRDKERQADEKLLQAKEILAKKTEDLTAADIERAESLAKQAKGIYKGLEDESDAVDGVKKAWDVLDEAVKIQQTQKRAELDSTIEKIKELEKEVRKIEAGVTVNVVAATADAEKELADVKKALAELKDKVITVTVIKKTKEAKQDGGTVGLATGGKLPGYGGGDKIDALLEAGEFVVRKEAVSKYGSALFHAFNSMRMPLKLIPRFAMGGMAGFKDIRRRFELSMNPYAPYRKDGVTYHINNPTFYNHIEETAARITQPVGMRAAANMTGIFSDAVVRLQSGGSITDSLTGIRSERDLIERTYAGQIDLARRSGEDKIAQSLAKEKIDIETLAAELELTLQELDLEYQTMLAEIDDAYQIKKTETEDALSSAQQDLAERKLELEHEHREKLSSLNRELTDLQLELDKTRSAAEPTVDPFRHILLPLNQPQREANASIPGIERKIRLKREDTANEKQAYEKTGSLLDKKEIKSIEVYNRDTAAAEKTKDRDTGREGKKYDLGIRRAETEEDLNRRKTEMNAAHERTNILNDMDKEIFDLQARMHRELMDLQQKYAQGSSPSIKYWLANGGPVPAFADGGGVFKRLPHPFIPGSGSKDDVPAMLMKGEFVLNKEAVKKYGLAFLSSINNMSAGINMIPKFAAGGMVGIKRKLQLMMNPLAPYTDNGVTYHIGHQSFHNHLQEKTAGFNMPEGKRSAANMINIFSAGAVKLAEGGGISTATERLAAEKIRISEEYTKQIDLARRSGQEEIAWLLEEERLELEQLASDMAFTLEEMAIEYAYLKDQLLSEYNYQKESLQQKHDETVAALTAEKLAIESQYKAQKTSYTQAMMAAMWRLHDLKNTPVLDARETGFKYAWDAHRQWEYDRGGSYSERQKQEEANAARRNEIQQAQAQYDEIRASGTNIEGDYKRNMGKATAALDRENRTYPVENTRMDAAFIRDDEKADRIYKNDATHTEKKYNIDTLKVSEKAAHDVALAQIAMEKEIKTLESDLARQLADLEKEYASTSMSGVKYWLAKGGSVGYPEWAQKGKDSIRAMLAPGEYVIKEAVVRSLGQPFFDALNNFKIPAYARFADGGYVGGTGQSPMMSDKATFDASVTFNIGSQSLKMHGSTDVAKTLVKELKKMGMSVA
jgi:hypothetical protein